jgi:spermidine/putrescine ABC transporter ATP-binding subunit
MASVTLDHVSKYFGEVGAVKDVLLTIDDGTFFTLLGPSGCGKTTILRMIAGFYQPTQGSVHIAEEDVTYVAPEKRNVGMVFQSYALFPHMTVEENVAYGLHVRKLTKPEKHERVNKYLDLVQLGGYAQRKISELSGGQQQRVALARALAIQPRILLLDEPLSNLDAKLRDEMRFELKQLQRNLGITAVYVTHDQTEALTMSDAIAVLDQGACQQVGTPLEIYDEPVNAFVANFIGDTNLMKATIEGEQAVIADKLTVALLRMRSGEYVSIRPEGIELSHTRTGHINEFQGNIAHVQFNGAISHYLIDVEGVQFKIMNAHSLAKRDDFRIGDSAFMTIHPQNIRVLS